MASEWHTATVMELQQAGVLLVEDGNHGEYRPLPNEFVVLGLRSFGLMTSKTGESIFQTVTRSTIVLLVEFVKERDAPATSYSRIGQLLVESHELLTMLPIS